MTDRLVSRGIKGTGPRKRNAVAIAALPHIEIIVGYFNLSQILNTKIQLNKHVVAVKIIREKNINMSILTKPPIGELIMYTPPSIRNVIPTSD